MNPISSSNEYFPRLGLFPEVNCYLAESFLDQPSRLSLALSSKVLYGTLGNRRCPHYVGVWTFLEDCVRLDYLELLKYAYANGARLDRQLLEFAVREGSEDLAVWLVQNVEFPKNPSVSRMKTMLEIAVMRGYWQFKDQLEQKISQLEFL